MTVAAEFAATLVDEWVRSGLTDAVIAPGSRSTLPATWLRDLKPTTKVFLGQWSRLRQGPL